MYAKLCLFVTAVYILTRAHASVRLLANRYCIGARSLRWHNLPHWQEPVSAGYNRRVNVRIAPAARRSDIALHRLQTKTTHVQFVTSFVIVLIQLHINLFFCSFVYLFVMYLITSFFKTRSRPIYASIVRVGLIRVLCFMQNQKSCKLVLSN